MCNWKAYEHHKAIVSWAQRFGVPILTTNFDSVLHEALSPMKCKRRRLPTRRRSYSHPWDCYYSISQISSPTQEFGIWHINGFQDYARSIRLGLTEYMGSVRQARSSLRSNRADSLLQTKDIDDWRGVNTWLQILLTKSLLIYGTAYAHGSGRESLPPDVEVEVRAGERVECSLYVPADGATT